MKTSRIIPLIALLFLAGPICPAFGQTNMQQALSKAMDVLQRVMDVSKKLETIDLSSKESIPVLIDMLRSDTGDANRAKAANFLVQIGTAAVPQLKEALNNADAGVRTGAAYVLYRLGLEKDADWQIIISSLHDSNTETRESAALTLKWLGSEGAPAVNDLTAALKDSDSFFRGYVVEALGAIGAAAKPALTDIISLLKNPDNRVDAVWSLTDIAKADKETVAEVTTVLTGAKAALPASMDDEDRLFSDTIDHALAVLHPPAHAYAFSTYDTNVVKGVPTKLTDKQYDILSDQGVSKDSPLLTPLNATERADLYLLLNQAPANSAKRFLVTRDLIRKWEADKNSLVWSEDANSDYLYSLKEQHLYVEHIYSHALGNGKP